MLVTGRLEAIVYIYHSLDHRFRPQLELEARLSLNVLAWKRLPDFDRDSVFRGQDCISRGETRRSPRTQ